MAADRLGVAGGGASRSIWNRLRSASVYNQMLKRRFVMTRQSFGFLRQKLVRSIDIDREAGLQFIRA
jgi:hypothetical protein